jgi:hypothetical protein
MTPAPHQIKIEHDGRLYLRWSRSSLDDAVEYVCDVKKGMFLHGNYTSASSDVLDELEKKRANYESALKACTSCYDEFDRGLIEGKEVVCVILQEWIKELRKQTKEREQG